MPKRVDLYPHQAKALEMLRPGTILYGGTGSGKSRAILAYYFVNICGGDLSHIEKGTCKDVPLYIITTAKKRDTGEWNEECSYFHIKPCCVDSWNNITKYTDVVDGYFILDEQRVVGSGIWVKSFLKIAKRNLWNILSATPGDQWIDYVPVFIANGFYKNRTEFLRRHVVFRPFSKYPQIDRYTGTSVLESLRKKILVAMPFSRERLVEETSLTCGFDADDMDDLLKHRWNPWDQKPIKNISELLSLMRRCVNDDASRYDVLCRYLKKKRSCIIFYNFDYELDRLRCLDSEGFEVFECNGHKHDPVPGTSCGKKWVYLVQYNAGAEGWNCVSTDTIVFYSRSYSYRMTEQAKGRIDRLNSLYPVLYYVFLESQAPIDRAILRCYNRKADFNQDALFDLEDVPCE